MEDLEKIIEKAVGVLRKKSIEGYEIYINSYSQFDVESKDGKVDFLNVSQSTGMSIRVLKNQRMGFSYLTVSKSSSLKENWFEKEVEKVIDDAISASEALSSDPCLEFAPILKEEPPFPPIFDGSLESISESKKIEKAKILEQVTLSVDPKIKKVRKASYQDSISRKILVNSNGYFFSFDTTLTSATVMAVAEDSGESEMGWDFDFSHFFNELDIERIGQRAGQMAIDKLGGRKINSGIYPVLLRNDVSSEFLSLLVHSFLAEQVLKGKSSLAGKIGERFFSPLISIFDDGLEPKGASCSPIDAEGTPSKKTPLVIKGEIKNYLYDIYWANRENLIFKEKKVKSTANSRRPTLKAPPVLGPSNLIIEKGNSPISEFLKKLNKGLLIDEVMGLHTVDPISGDFSLGCSGVWIEGGEKAYPVKSIAMAGNLFELFKKVIDVGNDFRFFGSVGCPSLLIESLEISGN